MSSSIPPDGPGGGAEYLEQGGGSPLGSSPKPAGSGRRKALIAGGAVVALALAGGAAAAAVWWSSTGAQPAEALPDSTLGYASIDLDPSGEQKVEAIKMLKKFPAFNDEIDLDTDDDLRQKMFEEFDLGEACDGLDYGDDIEPWLGDRAAVAAVDTGEDTPVAAFVLQIKDEGAAKDGLAKIKDCAGESGGEGGGWVINGDWAVVAESDKIAQGIVDDAAEAPLSDDEDYQKWTDEVGDAGVINMYAAPAAGKFLADSADSLFGMGMGAGATDFSSCVFDPEADPSAQEPCDDIEDMTGDSESMSAMPEEFTQALEDFQGAALTVRFDDGALEVEMAGDSALTEKTMPTTDKGDDVLSTLPEDTAAAIGVGLPEGWFSTMLDQMSKYTGGEMTADDVIAQAEAETGLELPDDIETLLGESTALAVSPDIDPEALVNSSSPEGLPIGVKIQGDPEEIEAILEKIRPQLGSQSEFLLSESEGDKIAIGLDQDYVSELLEDGDLGDSEVFKHVIREPGDASSIFFVNFDAGDGWLVKIAGDEKDVAENLEPLEGVGMSAWVEDDSSHVVFRVTTN
ncbi:MAG: DUF3352 domain-containing protein [Nocardioides sp.]